MVQAFEYSDFKLLDRILHNKKSELLVMIKIIFLNSSKYRAFK